MKLKETIQAIITWTFSAFLIVAFLYGFLYYFHKLFTLVGILP